ncbi:MAG: alpha-galactosidase [Lachnospiraceae bacterium]|nr:alpha-galactosidase [Lachnospiraceae bacterium]
MYSLSFTTEKNISYEFAEISPESGEYRQGSAVVSVKKKGNCSKITITVEGDRVKQISHVYTTALRNFNQIIAPDSGREFYPSMQPMHYWRKKFSSRVFDVKNPIFVFCGQDNCASVCFGVVGKDYEREFKTLNPHFERALSMVDGVLSLQITGDVPEAYREDIFTEGIYLIDEREDTGIPWTEVMREFHEIRRDWEQIAFPYTKKSLYPVWCNWQAWDSADADEKIVLDNVEEGVKLGIYNYIIDDGWFGPGLDSALGVELNIGDWESDPEKYPDMRRLSEAIHEKGGRSIIWCAPHAVGDGAKCRETRRKYLMADADGKLVYTGNGFNLLCLRNPKAREIMADICVRLAEAYDTDGAKYDLFNCIPDVECCCKDHEHDTESMIVGLERTMELIWRKVTAKKPDYIVELKQNYGGSKLSSFGTMMRAGNTPFCPQGNFLRTAYIQGYTPYAANDYQSITNEESHLSTARVIIKMLAVGVPTYSMDICLLSEEKKQILRFLNNWYIDNIVERDNYKRRALDGMLDTWMIEGGRENLYFMLNSAKELTVEGKDFQVLNASMHQQILLTSKEEARYQLQLFDHAGRLIAEYPDVSLGKALAIDREVVLIKGKCIIRG